MAIRAGSRLERILHDRNFVVTAEAVPPRGGVAEPVLEQARALVGYADAVNVTDSPTSAAHMSPVAGAALVAREGLEPTMQITTRDRNRLAITGDLLGGWALGARNLLCLTGDPVAAGDHPEAKEVGDLSVIDLVRFAVQLRDRGQLLSGQEVEHPPRYFVGVADEPLARDYDPGRLEAKADAGADFVQTQIVFDVDAIGTWAEQAQARGIFERMFVLVGVAPPRSAATARYLRDNLAGVVVPDAVISRLEEGGEDEGVRLTVDIVGRLRAIRGIAGIHVIGLGHEEAVRRLIEAAGLLPRPEPGQPRPEPARYQETRVAAIPDLRLPGEPEPAAAGGGPATAPMAQPRLPEPLQPEPEPEPLQPQPQPERPEPLQPEPQPLQPEPQPLQPEPVQPQPEPARPEPEPERQPVAQAAQPEVPAEPAGGGWTPTHAVPAGGMLAWQAPHPSAPQSAQLQPGLPIQVVERLGAWARVVASNGWWGWVDGRLLP
jgi:5,10-methylenetetrahydrofolate reductase